jgi:hypothetical protein
MNENKLKSFFSSLKSAFAEAEQEETDATFADIKAVDGTLLQVSDIMVDATINIIETDGSLTPAEGEWELEDGTKIVAAAGVITEVVDAETEDAEPAVEIEIEAGADKKDVETKMMAVLLQDGTEVQVETQVEGEITVGDIIAGAEDGEYILEDGRVIVVAAEAITEIKPVEMEEAEPTAEEKEITGVVNNLKELINQVKDLKSQFEALKEENAKIKSNFAAANKVASLDQEVKFETSKPKKSSPLRNAVGM